MHSTTTQKRKTLMNLSWEIQRKKKITRSKSLQSAWAITQNDDIVVYHLVRKHSTQHSKQKAVNPFELQLFSY